MKITFSSILMAVFWSGILVGIIYRMRKKSYFVKSFGIGCIVLVYLFCVLRMLLPIDFSFTQGITVYGIFADINKLFCMKEFLVGNYNLTISDVFVCIWLMVSAVLILKFLYEYKKICRVMNNLTVNVNEQYTLTLQKVYAEKNKAHKVTLLTSEEIQMPLGIGVWKWRILLPERAYTDQELYYILLHEYTHFLNGDLIIKMLTYVFCCIFWWNPMMYFLKKDLDRNLEMKCDLCVTEKLPLDETAEYLETIVQTLRTVGKKKYPLIVHSAAALGNDEKDEMIERFQLVVKNQKSKRDNRKNIVIWLVMFLIIWIASYSFLPLPGYEAPIEEIEDEPGNIEITPDNSYVVFKNGRYYWFVEGSPCPYEEITAELAKELEAYGLEIKE